MPLLFLYFLSTLKSTAGSNRSIIAALLFSWVGDIFLLFDSQNSLYFIFGLSAFLIAHVFYIFFFMLYDWPKQLSFQSIFTGTGCCLLRGFNQPPFARAGRNETACTCVWCCYLFYADACPAHAFYKK